MAIKALPLSSISDDNNKLIFNNFELPDLIQCCRVSTVWKKYANGLDLWTQHIPEITRFVQTDIKKYTHSYTAVSEEMVEKCLSEFMRKVPLDQKCSFICFFPLDPACSISADFGCRYCSKEDINPEYTEVCIFLKKPPNGAARDPIQSKIPEVRSKAGILSGLSLYHFRESQVILPNANWEESMNNEISRIWEQRLNELKKQNKITKKAAFSAFVLLGIGCVALQGALQGVSWDMLVEQSVASTSIFLKYLPF